MRQNFENIRNERDTLRAQVNFDRQNLGLLSRQNIEFRRRLQEHELDTDESLYLLNLTISRYKKWKNKYKTRDNDLFLSDFHLDRLYGELNGEQAQNHANSN